MRHGAIVVEIFYSGECFSLAFRNERHKRFMVLNALTRDKTRGSAKIQKERKMHNTRRRELQSMSEMAVK